MLQKYRLLENRALLIYSSCNDIGSICILGPGLHSISPHNHER